MAVSLRRILSLKSTEARCLSIDADTWARREWPKGYTAPTDKLPRMSGESAKRGTAAMPYARSSGEHYPGGRVVARVFFATHGLVDTSRSELRDEIRTEQKMIEAQAGVARPPVPHV